MVVEFGAVGDVVAVEALVFERLDPALDDSVGTGLHDVLAGKISRSFDRPRRFPVNLNG